MWSNLPFDLIANIFFYLPPDSLARAKAACRNWRESAECVAKSAPSHRHLSWFIAFQTRGQGNSCYVHNPIGDIWHVLPLNHIISPIKPIAKISSGLVLLKFNSTISLKLAICNPFTKQFKILGRLNVPRTNPAIGVVDNEFGLKIYVAGGMSEAASGGAVYQPTIEMYNSIRDTWKTIGPMPVEFAVRLTVWTPNESVYSNGILYWMTSARAYSVMGFEIGTSKWRESSVPMADRLDFAALVPKNGKLAMVGGMSGGDIYIWELGGDGFWSMVEKVPFELVIKLLGNKLNWASVKCVGIDGAVCLYRDVGSGMIVWREDLDDGKWNWAWVKGCCSIRGRSINNFSIKGLLLHPNLSHIV